MYKPGCHVNGPIKFRCLSLVGWLFTIVFTYTGFACLVVGTFWSANMGIKFKHTWRSIRGDPDGST